jgi:hypothetical protein
LRPQAELGDQEKKKKQKKRSRPAADESPSKLAQKKKKFFYPITIDQIGTPLIFRIILADRGIKISENG